MKNFFHVFLRMFTKFFGERPSKLAVFLCMALFASTTAFAEEYITDVMVIGGDKDRVDFLKDSCGAQGWTVIDKNLNDNTGVGTDYVYLLYKKSSESGGSNGFITDFIIKTDEYPDSYIFNGRTYYRIPHKGSEHFEIHGGNLNSGTVSSSTNMRLYYTKEEFPDRRFVRDIAFTDAKLKSGYTTLGRNGAVVGSDGSGAMDLNEGAGSSSDYIYMHFATVSSSMDTPEYISDVVVLGGSKDEVNALKERYASRGWIVIDQDLNDNAGAGTDYIYMAYKKSHFSDVNKGFITDFIIKTGEYPDTYKFNGRTYYRAPNFGDGNFAIYGGNLNSGTVSSSTNMWLYFTRESFPDTRVVSDIAFTVDEKTLKGYTTLGENGAAVGSDGSGAMDLNEGAGSSSDYIYMHFATAPKVNITFVTGLNNVSVPMQTVVSGSTATKPSDPERTGLKFAGWYADESFTTEFDFSAPVTSNTAVYVKWEASVTFVTGVENVSVPTQTIVFGNTPTKPADLERSGFTFMGWYTTANGTTQFDFSAPVTNDVSVYARWAHLVTFVTGDANVVVPTQLVFVGEAPTKPSDPERTGLRFAGWYADESFSTEFDFSAPVTKNTAAYAKWEASVTFVTGVENVSVPTQTIVYGYTPTKPDDPERTGFKFMGWFTTADGNMEFDFDARLNGNAIAYAKWGVPYIDEKGVEQLKQPGEYTVLTNSTDVNPLSDGWYVVVGDVEYSLGIFSIASLNIILADNAILNINSTLAIRVVGDMAIYGQKKQTGLLRAIGVGPCILADNDIFINGGSIEVVGDYTTIDANDISINGGSIKVDGESSGFSASGNLVLSWNDANGRILANYYHAQGKVNVADGLAFIDEEDNYYWGELTKSQISDIAGKTLIPVTSCSIFFATGDENVSVPTQTVVFGSTSTKPDDPVRSGFKFMGWYANETFTTEFDFSAPIIGNTTVYAKWGVPFIDENGKEQVKQPGEYTLLTNITDVSDLATGWYVVAGDVIYYSKMTGSIGCIYTNDGCELNIILTSGANFTVNSDGNGFVFPGNITFYGQKRLTGKFTVNAEGYGIRAKEISINGGSISVNGHENGLNAARILLGWSNADDRVMANNYLAGDEGGVKIADGQAFKDPHGNIYYGSLTASQISVIAGKVLSPCYLVTFDARNGSDAISVSTYFDENNVAHVSAPDVPTCEGYQFMGWFTTADGDTQFDFSAPITSNTTIYARWGHIVTFVTGDANVVVPSQTVFVGDAPTKPSDPERTGLRFAGWFADESFSTEIDFSAPITKNTTVYAKWEASVTFVAGDENVSVPTQTIVYGYTPTKPDDPERIGLKFVGWYADDAFTTVYDFSAPVTNDVSVYARWWKGIFTDLSTLTDHHVAENGELLMGTLGGNYKVSIADGATVTFDGVTINGVDHGAYQWAGLTCKGDCKIILKGENTVKGFFEDYPGIYVPEGKTLIIEGDGLLDASSNGVGAGIGGGFKIDCGNIVINGGTVTATGGSNAAGIGSGYEASVGSITISGGTVTATGDKFAAGIGSGNEASAGSITISGGSVTATGGLYAAGIGSGYYNATVGDITISGGTVTATGSDAAGIGSGDYHATAGSITISGGSVTATGGDSGAGIGSGYNATVGDITITDGVTLVTANKGERSPNSVGLGEDGKSVGKISIGGVFVDGISESPYTFQTYDVVFNANGGTGNMEKQRFVYDANPTALSKNIFTREGYTFVGWNTRADGEGLAYSNREKVQDLVSVSGAEITLYAQWNKTVQSLAAIVISQDGNGKLHATIDGDYAGTDIVSIDDENGIVVDKVELDRTLSTVGYATITLPFGIDSVKVKGAKQFLKFVGVILNEETKLREVHFERAWCDLPALLDDIDNLKDLSDEEKKEKKEKVSAKCNAVPKKLFAYTPYVVQMKAETLTFDDGVTLVKTPATVDTVVGNWKFKGTLAPKIWEEGDPEIGNAYGYVAGTGEFKKVGDKSSIGALRSYLVYEKQTKTQSSANVPAGASTIRANFSTEFLPANMDVVIVDDDENGKEHRTVIGKFNTHTGEFKFTLPENGTFDVKGRRVNETRSVGKGRKAKGVYYGRKK